VDSVDARLSIRVFLPIPLVSDFAWWDIEMAWTFLVVDGNELDSAQTAAQLRRLQPSAEILTASDGRTAFDLLETQRLVPSLTFIDFAMPGMNAIEFLGELRRLRWLDKAPIAMLTEPIADRHVVNCYRFGACAFLTKPVPLYHLRETLRDYAEPARRLTAASLVPAGPTRQAA
jgi:CheY-like chemotaxis protein